MRHSLASFNIRNMIMILKTIPFLIFLFLSSMISCLPIYVNSLRLYDRETGNTIQVALSDAKSNQGSIYSTQNDTAPNSEIFKGEYYIYGESRKYQHPDQQFMNEQSLAEEYGFGENSDAKPVGTAILIGNQGTVIEVIFYKVDSQKKNGDGIGRDNEGNIYRVYLSEKIY